MIVQEYHNTIQIKINQTKLIEIIPRKDHENTSTIDQIVKQNNNRSRAENKTTTTQTDTPKETTLSHHVEITFDIQIQKAKTTQVIHQNIKDKLIKYNLQKKFNQILTVLTKQRTQNYS